MSISNYSINIFSDVDKESLYFTLALSLAGFFYSVLLFACNTKFCGKDPLWKKSLPCLRKCFNLCGKVSANCCVKCCSPLCNHCCSCCANCCAKCCATLCGKCWGEGCETDCGVCCLGCCGETQKYTPNPKDDDKSCIDNIFSNDCTGRNLSYAVSFIHCYILKSAYITVTVYYFSFVASDVLGGYDRNQTSINETSFGDEMNITDFRLLGESLASSIAFYCIVAELIIFAIQSLGGCGIITSTFCHDEFEHESTITHTTWKGWNESPDIIGCYVRAYEYHRTIDILIAAFIAPISHVQMFYLGGYLYAIIAARTIYHCATFAAVAIAGFRFMFCCCVITCDLSLGVESEDVQIRNFKHLIVGICPKLVSIFTKIMTGSSALATYLKIGILVRSQAFRIAYFTFTVIRGVTAMFNMIFTALLLRWEVLEEDIKNKSKSCFHEMLKWLHKFEPHSIIAFIVDSIAYGGLIALNLVILFGLIE